MRVFIEVPIGDAAEYIHADLTTSSGRFRAKGHLVSTGREAVAEEVTIEESVLALARRLLPASRLVMTDLTIRFVE